MRRSFIPCLALIFTCAAASAQPATQPAEKPLGVKIGVTEITIPAPHGFVHMSKAPSQIQSSFEMMTPQTNRFLGGFLLPSATVIPESGVIPPLDQYMLVQTLRAARESMCRPRISRWSRTSWRDRRTRCSPRRKRSSTNASRRWRRRGKSARTSSSASR